MSVFEVGITFLAAILSIAYPILIEVISRLDEKYDSIIITDLFYEETTYKTFKFSLYSGLLFVLLYFLKLTPPDPFPSDIYLLNHSALILFALSVLTLIISFFSIINKVFIYYRPLHLVSYFIKCHDRIEIRSDDDYNNKYFNALTDISFFSIRNQNRKIAKELSGFFYLRFKEIRDKSNYKPLIYPASYYELVYKSIEELANFRLNRLPSTEDYTAGSIYLLGEFSGIAPSEPTYNWIWANQKLALKFDRDDLVLEHWKNAHQFYDTGLEFVNPEHGANFQIVNQAEVDRRIKERRDFFVFHTILGALVLHTRKYETLGKIFSYTQSIPPKYVLLPERMDTIFELFMKVTDNFNDEFNNLSFKFPFPDFHGIHADERISEVIAEYLALLFIRQYSIVPYLVYQKPMDLPPLPTTMGEKKKWLENIPYFKRVVQDVLSNKALLDATKLNFITSDYLEKAELLAPLDLLSKFETQLQQAIEQAEVNQDISAVKRQKFIDTTKAILSSTFEEYKPLIDKEAIVGDTSSSYINGEIQIVDRSSLADNQGFDHLNFHSILGEKLGEKFQRWVSESFFVMKKERYLIKQDQIEDALDRLNLESKNVCIVSFWEDLPPYKNIPIIKIIHANRRLFQSAIFILPLIDLPSIIFRQLKEELVNEYKLEKILEQYNVYASLINLNENEHLHKDVYKSGFDGDIRKQALMNIFIHGEFRWRRNSKCIMLQIASPYREEGIITSIGDINEF